MYKYIGLANNSVWFFKSLMWCYTHTHIQTGAHAHTYIHETQPIFILFLFLNAPWNIIHQTAMLL